MKHGARIVSAVAGLMWAATACGSADLSGNAAGFGPAAEDGGTSAPSGSGGSSGGYGGGTSADSGPPEIKVEDAYQSPVSTGQYVWVANPSSGRVAYIQAATLAVATVAAGDGPTYLAAVPDATADSAIVMNVRSHDATLLRASGGALTTATFPLAADLNAWSVSADGRWALAWGDATRATSPDPTQGFQDVSVLDLSGAVPPTIVSVGYRPVKVTFSSDASRAFAVTQDGISVIDLTGAAPLVTKNFPVTSDPSQDPSTEDVSITPDGTYALVRTDGSPTVNVVALSDGRLTPVTLPANATDLTLTPAGDRALVVLRDVSTVVTLPVPGIAANPASYTTLLLPGQTVGRAIVADDGVTALLFTTVLPVDSMIVLDLATQQFRTEPLHLPVLAVFPTHDASTAIVLHTLPADAGTSAQGAFSVAPVGANLPAKLVGTDAPPNAVALSPASDRAVVTTRDDGLQVYAAYLAKMPSLEVDRFSLASPPIGAGVVAGANVAWIAQSNPEGRITFIDLVTSAARTLTGFELGSRVVDGSQP